MDIASAATIISDGGRSISPGSDRRRKLGVTLGVVDLVVTGADGRVGRLLRAAWLVHPPKGLRLLWASRGKDADILWDIESGPAPDLPPGAVVLHLAGVVRGGDLALRRNVAMLPALFAACRQAGVRRLMIASSAAVYAPGPQPADEADPLAPARPYGVSKAQVEALAMASGLPVTLLRFGNLAGADALLSPRADGDEIVLDPVPGQDGGPLRSWIGPLTLADTVAGLALLPDLPKVLNIACDPPLPMADLLLAAGLPWRFGPENPAVVPVATLATNRLSGLLHMPKAVPAALIGEMRQIGLLP